MKQLTSEDLKQFISDTENIYNLQVNGVSCNEMRIGKNNSGEYYINLIESKTERFIKDLQGAFPYVMTQEYQDMQPVSQEFLDECKRVAKKYPLINEDKTIKHDGCDGCLHLDKEEYAFPCNKCKQSYMDNYKRK